jgi:hypothetical protein
MSLTTLGWLFTLGVLFHNLEEALYLPRWSHTVSSWYRPVDARSFRHAILLFSAIVFILTALSATAPDDSPSAYLMAGLCLAMLLNAIAPHLLLTLSQRRYMPGTATGFAFNVPLGAIYLHKSLLQNHIRAHTFFWAGPLVTLAFLLLIPLLFAVSKRL